MSRFNLPVVVALSLGANLAFGAESQTPSAINSDRAAQSATSAGSAEQNPAGVGRPRDPRVLFITSTESEKCATELARLNSAGGDFEKLRQSGWTIGAGPENHLQIVDAQRLPEGMPALEVSEYPAIVCLSQGQIVRSYQSGCTTPLDVWTFGFLAKGTNERPAVLVPEAARVAWTGHYPLRGNHWSIDEDWSPTREKVLAHLRGPAHGHQVVRHGKIEAWSYEELRSLHDNIHEQEMGGVSYAARSSQPSNPFSATRKTSGR